MAVAVQPAKSRQPEPTQPRTHYLCTVQYSTYKYSLLLTTTSTLYQ